MDHEGKLCYFCSAWQSSGDTDSANLGHCVRYSMKARAYEWCETWSSKRSSARRTLPAITWKRSHSPE